MSFSGEAKAEMCRVKPQRECCVAAEIYGSLIFANTFDCGEIRLSTENAKFSERIQGLIQRQFGLGFDKIISTRKGNVSKETLIIDSGEKLQTVLGYYGYDLERHVSLRLNAALLEEEHCREAFVRGMFLSSGSVTDPGRTYHLEIVTRHFNLSREVMALLLDMGFEPKSTMRK